MRILSRVCREASQATVSSELSAIHYTIDEAFLVVLFNNVLTSATDVIKSLHSKSK